MLKKVMDTQMKNKFYCCNGSAICNNCQSHNLIGPYCFLWVSSSFVHRTVFHQEVHTGAGHKTT